MTQVGPINVPWWAWAIGGVAVYGVVVSAASEQKRVRDEERRQFRARLAPVNADLTRKREAAERAAEKARLKAERERERADKLDARADKARLKSVAEPARAKAETARKKADDLDDLAARIEAGDVKGSELRELMASGRLNLARR